MRGKRLCLLGFIFLFFNQLVVAESGPRLELDSNHRDLGEITAGQITEKIFKVENTGDQELIIKKIITSCGCTSAQISSYNISPGAKAELKVTYDSKGVKEGRDTKDIYIFSNDPQNPKSTITIWADIVESQAIGIKSSIYAKLKCCNCGESFTSCSCAHAKEMKTYIEAFLEAGLVEEEILVKIAQKYSLDAVADQEAKKAVEKKLIAEAGDKRPQILIKPLSFDYGKVSKSKGELELIAKVKNKGRAVLTIKGLSSSCSCTAVKLRTKKGESPLFGAGRQGPENGWKADLEPGQEAELIIITDLNHPNVKLGSLARSITINSNDPVHSIVTVEFRAEIVE